MFGSTILKENLNLFQNAEKHHEKQVLRELRRDYVPAAVEFKKDPAAAKKIRRKHAVLVGCGIALGIAGASACYAAGKQAGLAEADGVRHFDGDISDAALTNTFDYSGV